MDSDYDDPHSAFGSDILQLGLLAPQGCPVCTAKFGLRVCGGCGVVSYCGTEHQVAHRSNHKKACNAIKKTRETLEREEATLRAHPGDALMRADVFNSCVGRFWGIWGTRAYMRARFAAADALLRIDTKRAIETALDHFNDMLRLNRSDDLGVRDIIPHLLLRLGQEQECYDFLKWWATIGINGDYDWGNMSLPYLDIHGADAFEPIDMFCSRFPNLSHLVALTLLKLRLYLDLDAYTEFQYDSCMGLGDGFPELGRLIGNLLQARIRTTNRPDFFATVEELKSQYRRLCRMVNDANSHFWDALIACESSSPPSHYTRGSEEEADLVLYQCQRAWEESEDAIVMIDAETSEFTRVYEGTTADSDMDDVLSEDLREEAQRLEIRRGTGNMFPSRFKPQLPTFSPAELFPPTLMGRNQTVRFVCRDDRTKVLAYADGACVNNGQQNPRAGWAVVCGSPEIDGEENRNVVSARLEEKGPFGDDAAATSNRAELRAAIAVLRLCDWRDEGCASIVIATDSSYVVEGATSWAKGWMRKGWTTRTGGDVKNRDLWELLLGEVERWDDQGVRVQLWRIPRELNSDADAAAKRAARDAAAEPEFRDITMGSPQPTTTSRNESGHRVLALCLEHESLFDACFGDLISHITSRAKMERATTPEAALAILDQESPPDIILVADGALTRQRKVFERVIDRLRQGATVVLAGCFSNMVTEGEFNRFFARLGLPWKRGSYFRTTVSLRRDVVDSHLTRELPTEFSQKTLFVAKIEKSAAWYTECGATREAAMAFTKVGSGRLGYIGDVNGEEGSNMVVLAMCGLLG